jgi:hypothetical protein
MIKFTKILLFSVFILVTISGCRHEQKFTTVKWLSGDGLDFPERDDIVDNLLQSYKLQGMTYKQVHHLLGYPQWSDSTSFYYQVLSTYTNKLKHNHVKNLVFYMGKDSIITKVALYDNKVKK